MKEEDDPFGSLSTFSLIPMSQSNRLRSLPFSRQHERFPNTGQLQSIRLSQNYKNTIHTQAVGIRIESPPEEDEDVVLFFGNKMPKVFDKMPVREKIVKKRVLNVWSSSDGFSVGTQTDDLSEEQNVKVGFEMPVRNEGNVESLGKKARVFTGSEGSKRGFADLGGDDRVFDEMPMRFAVKKDRVLTVSEGSKMGLADLGGDDQVLPVRKAAKIELVGKKSRVLTDLEGSKRGLGGGKNREVKMGIEVIDLEEDCEDSRIQIWKGKSKTDLDEDTPSNQVVDLDEYQTSDDLPIRIGKDGPNGGGDLTTKNLIGKHGPSEGDEVCKDGIIGFREKGIVGIGNGKRVSWKDDENRQTDKGSCGWPELYDSLSPRRKGIVKACNKVGEPCRDGNRGSSEKGVEEICRRNVVINDEPRRDVIRGCSLKDTNASKDNNNQGKGKSQARRLPSSLCTLAEAGIKKTSASHSERSKKAVEKNTCEKEISEPVGQKSKNPLHELLSSVGGKTTNDEIMKNLLDGLDLIIGKEKEKVDDGPKEEVDILETAMKLGIVLPRPRWWPEEGFGDE